MAKIAHLGTGLLGAAMIEASVARGDEVVVWNRTAARAEALVARLREQKREGARAAASPAAAVKGAERVHVTLSDDAAVDALLPQIVPALAPGAVIVDHTTTSPKGTRARY